MFVSYVEMLEESTGFTCPETEKVFCVESVPSSNIYKTQSIVPMKV